ncbi:MAG: outer membrane protein assembly factor BamC [Gammaproteobacteria bacterium]|nr:outer membrane protein assembly factor BamC [Gammaproteobacteria bacterium]
MDHLNPYRTVGRGLVLACAALALGACATRDITIQDKKIEYQQAYEVPQLEVPPDLTTNSMDDRLVVPDINPRESATYSAYAGERQGGRVVQTGVLPAVEGVRLERRGDMRWLVIDSPPTDVFGATRDFFLDLGFLLTREDQTLGILETDWLENRAAIPQGFIRRTLTKIPGVEGLYSSDTLDRYRVRLERGAEPGTTELYLTMRGLEKVAKGPEFVWQPRPSDPELEAEMLVRLMMYWGATEERARLKLAQPVPRPDRARLLAGAGGEPTGLVVLEPFPGAWRRTGVALDRIGFAVEDQDREDGIYRVRYQDLEAGREEKGLLSKLAFWSDDKPDVRTYGIRLSGDGEETRIDVRDEAGADVQSSTSQTILRLLYEELR